MNRNPRVVVGILLLTAITLLLGCKRRPLFAEVPSGPQSGRAGVWLAFTSSATDPGGDSVAVRFDWGDGDTSDWSAWLASGTAAADSHAWSATDTHFVRAGAKNTAGLLSDWSDPFAISIVGGWTKTFGGAADDEGCAVVQSADGGCVVAGYTFSFGAGESQVYLIKTDASGSQEWARTYGDSAAGFSAQPTTDGGYIVTGRCPGGIFLLKADPDGNQVWDRTFNGVSLNYGQLVLQTHEGAFVVVCLTDDGHACLIKVDASGNQVWANAFGADGVGGIHSVLQASDEGYVFVGEVNEPSGEEYFDICLGKSDGSGNEIWTKSYPMPSRDDYGYSLQPTSDGGYVIAGEADGESGIALHLIKTDADGNEIWTREFGGPNDVMPRAIQRTSDDGYVVTGYVDSHGATSYDVYLLRIDENGDSLWAMTYGGANVDLGYSVKQTLDGGFLITGGTWSYGAGKEDIWLIKTDSQGGVVP